MVNAFSFCLYGPENPRYYPGMLENIALAKTYFPDWVVYVYIAPDVDESMLVRLSACSNVRLRNTGVTGAINMIHRFYAIDESDVELMMVRDADSRIHWKDRWAIREFVKQPQYVAHTIRDNLEHTASMMGGLWGIRKSAGLNMRSEYAGYNEYHEKGHRNGHDQNFLADVVYHKVVDRMLIHYSNNRRRVGETAVEFPFTWINDVYCGRIECDFYDTPQPPPKSLFIEPSEFAVRKMPESYTPPIVKFLARK